MQIKNPIPITRIGDPYVIYAEGRYYMYATSRFNGYYCWYSDDLVNWSEPVICYQAGDDSFGEKEFWAPEVYYLGDQYYMYYTAQWKIHEEEELRIGVAVSESPLGPFTEVYSEKPMFDFGYGVLDAHILQDGDKNYLYYSRAGANHYVDGKKESQIYVVELGKDFISVVGEGKLILRPEQGWEVQMPEIKQVWTEGPFVLKHNDEYHMMYSANHYASKFYGIGVAVAKDPMGPYIRYEENPVLATNEKISGPGHNSVVKAADGNYYCVFHAHTDYNNPSRDRQVYICPLSFVDDRITIDTSII